MRIQPLLVLSTIAVFGCGDNSILPHVTIGGTVSGLAGSGLVLRDNGGDDLAVSSDGTFTLSTMVQAGKPYAVTVSSQPTGPTQTCVVANGSGMTPATAVANVEIACSTSSFAIGGTVTGMAGAGLVLQDNGADDLSVAADGSFTFATMHASGDAFAVTVKTQPTGPAQSCMVSGATGTVGAGAVTSVVVDCSTNHFTIGGTVTGLAGTVMLKDNGGDTISVTSNGTFAFPTTLASGTTYAVTIADPPGGGGGLSQHCVVTTGTGTVTNTNVTTVVVTCTTNKFTIGGTVAGLDGTGLVLQDNAGDDLPISADGGFTFVTPVASGATFGVTVKTEPTGDSQTCIVTAGAGTVGDEPVTTVMVSCATDQLAVAVTVVGLSGSIGLEDNGSDDFTVTADGTYAFATTVASGALYDVTVASHPTGPSQTCIVMDGSGTATDSTVTATVTCTTNAFNITGTLSGLATAETVTLQDNSGDDAVLATNGTFTFGTQIASGQTYSVTVSASPTSPIAQTCTVTNGSGTVGAADVTNVTVACAATTYPVSVTVSGLVGTLVLQDNSADDLSETADGTYAFATPIASGATYDVTVETQPSGQTCTVTSGGGTIGSSAVTIDVACVTGGGVTAFGGFRPALTCEDFVDNGNNVQQWCFTLKGQTLCMGAWASDGACTDTANGIEITTDAGNSWPLRFNNNQNICANYNPDPGALTNLANALGYASYTVHLTETGNGCPLTWIDASGNYVTDGEDDFDDASLAEIYDISFF